MKRSLFSVRRVVLFRLKGVSFKPFRSGKIKAIVLETG